MSPFPSDGAGPWRNNPTAQCGRIGNAWKLPINWPGPLQKSHPESQYAKYAKAPQADTLLHISHTQTLAVEAPLAAWPEPGLARISWEPANEALPVENRGGGRCRLKCSLY